MVKIEINAYQLSLNVDLLLKGVVTQNIVYSKEQ